MKDRVRKLAEFLKRLEDQIGPENATQEERARFQHKSTHNPPPSTTLPSNN